MVETIVPPEAAPVALAELRAFLRIEGVDGDAELAAQLRVATELCEGFIGAPLLERTLRETLAAGGGVAGAECCSGAGGDGGSRAFGGWERSCARSRGLWD